MMRRSLKRRSRTSARPSCSSRRGSWLLLRAPRSREPCHHRIFYSNTHSYRHPSCTVLRVCVGTRAFPNCLLKLFIRASNVQSDVETPRASQGLLVVHDESTGDSSKFVHIQAMKAATETV